MPMMDSQRIAVLSPGMADHRLKILILGGTGEARALASAVAARTEFDAVISLAGRTKEPLPQALPHRVSGFGGIEGLRRYIADNGIKALIDATHPFAAQMSRHAVEAAGKTPLLRIERPPWQHLPGDNWRMVGSAEAAARTIGNGPERAFLATGRLDLDAFRAVERPMLIRTVDPMIQGQWPEHWRMVTGLGPFTVEEEMALIEKNEIVLIVTKNSGGDATAAKLVAARRLNLPVVMIERPQLPNAESVETVSEAIDWLLERHHEASMRGTPTERAV
jgi:precorrin-6A/cobalt-precorrin-6A reductase